MADIESSVTEIRHLLKNHRSLTQEQTECVNAWLEQLLKTSNSDSERSNLLKYAKFLEYQLKHRHLSHPFDKPPPKDKLAPLSATINLQLNWNETDPRASKSDPCKTKHHGNDRNPCDWGPNTSWMKNNKDQESESSEECNNMTQCKQMMRIFENAKTALPLTDFLTQIVPFTGDNGELIREVAYSELNAFRELVFRIFTDRIQQVDKVLSSRQCLLKHKYAAMEQQLLNRAKMAQTHLKQLLPGFNYNEYIRDSNYIRNILMEIDKKEAGADPNCEPKLLSPENAIKQQQFKLKHLKDEMRQREEENEELMDVHNNLMLQLNQAIKEQQEKSQENIKRNKDLKDKLAGLKITAAENQALIDKYFVEKVRGKQ